MLFHTHYNEYFKENIHMFNACDVLAELTQYVPPKRVQLIRRYGLYSSRIKGAWETMPHIAERASTGWRKAHEQQVGPSLPEGFEPQENADLPDESPDAQAYRKAWARLLSKVYEIEGHFCYPGTSGNRPHFTASRMPGRAGAESSDQARKTGAASHGG